MEYFGWSFRECECVRCTHQGWTNEWASQAGAQGTNLQGALRCHWNNWKYGAVNLRFPHWKNLSENYPEFGHAPTERFTSPVLGWTSSKNVSLKGHQIISLSVAPIFLEPALVHTSQTDSFYRTGIWKPFIFLKFTIHMSIWLLYVIMW
jgi:hypothetical protein